MFLLAAQKLRPHLQPARRTNVDVPLLIAYPVIILAIPTFFYLAWKYGRKTVQKGTTSSGLKWIVMRDHSDCPGQLYWEVFTTKSMYLPPHPLADRNGYVKSNTKIDSGCAASESEAVARANQPIFEQP